MFNNLLKLTKQLFPTGRAFRFSLNGIKQKYTEGLLLSEQRALDDAYSVLYTILPDNDNFTADDASIWENRLGLINGDGKPLADRKAAILRKYRYPGDILPRQSAQYIEDQLQLAGFDVYVHENRFFPGPVTKSPGELGVTPLPSVVQHGQFQHGQIQHGQSLFDICANYIDSDLDSGFVMSDLRATFYISDVTLPDFADVDSDRKAEFRELILKLKPAHSAAFLFINYT